MVYVGKILDFIFGIQRQLGDIPYLSYLSILPERVFLYIFAGISAFLLILIIWILVSIIRAARRSSRKRAVRKAFGITDLSKFTVRKMGKPGSKYYSEDGYNSFHITLPHWKFANEDGSRQNRRVNKVIWEECHLWLHDGRKTYVLSTTDPYDMIYLVHTLRSSGVDIAPCAQELDKQERMEREKKTLEESMRSILDKADGDSERFARICRERLTIRGYNLSDAPMNDEGLNYFFRKGHTSVVVKCQLVSRDYLVGLDEMKGVKGASEELFAESCLFITTGRLSVAAAGYAMANSMEIICNEKLVELMEEDKPMPPEKMFLKWELTNEDLRNLLSEDLLRQIFC